MTSSEDPDRLQKVYMTINIESDGPDPGINNLLELSCILHYESGEIIDELNIKLKPESNRRSDENTINNFWKVNEDAWNWVKEDNVDVNTGINKFVNWYEFYSKKFSIRFVGDPASRDFVWLQEYYTNYAPFANTKLLPYCRCLTTMRKSYQKMLGLTDTQSWDLKKQLQGNDEETSHKGYLRAKKQAKEFCALRKLMYEFKINYELQIINNIEKFDSLNDKIDLILSKQTNKFKYLNERINNLFFKQKDIFNILNESIISVGYDQKNIFNTINENIIHISKNNTEISDNKYTQKKIILSSIFGLSIFGIFLFRRYSKT